MYKQVLAVFLLNKTESLPVAEPPSFMLNHALYRGQEKNAAIVIMDSALVENTV
jgi:hypothetical protein